MKKIKIIFIVAICFLQLTINNIQAQNIGINSTGVAPDASALLDLDASPDNNKGLLIPRLTTVQRDAISNPAEALLIFNTDTKCFNVYKSGAWWELCGVCTPMPTTANAGIDQLNTSGTTTSLDGNTPASGSGTWSIISGTGGNITTPTSPASTFTGTAGNSYTLQWTITNPCGSSSDDVEISFAAPDPNPCIAKTFGGLGTDILAYAWEVGNMIVTSDGGYAIAGITDSWGAGLYDVWIIKLDATGNIVWQKTYGSADNDQSYSIIQTSDGGYAVAGYYGTSSTNADVWVLKLDATGNFVWQKTYGGADNDYAYSIIQTIDGGYAVAGLTSSSGAGGNDAWVLKLTSTGTITWQKTYGGLWEDNITTIVQTSGGDYVISGKTSSFGAGNYDLWVLKLDGSGNILWQTIYGTADPEQSITMIKTSDGGYVLNGRIGMLRSFLLVKLDDDGNIIWQKKYGDDITNFVGESIIQTSDGGYASVGFGISTAGQSYNYVVNKLDGSGNLIWQKDFGDTGVDMPTSIVEIASGKLAIVGTTTSYGAGGYDILFLKIAADGTGPSCTNTTALSLTPITLTVASTAVTEVNTSVGAVNTSVTPANTSATVITPCTCP
ncbi:MAG: hypothetical protein ABIJ97_04255 [Bacteroidota bacterium]